VRFVLTPALIGELRDHRSRLRRKSLDDANWRSTSTPGFRPV
jgi:hypothetical protein